MNFTFNSNQTPKKILVNLINYTNQHLPTPIVEDNIKNISIKESKGDELVTTVTFENGKVLDFTSHTINPAVDKEGYALSMFLYTITSGFKEHFALDNDGKITIEFGEGETLTSKFKETGYVEYLLRNSLSNGTNILFFVDGGDKQYDFIDGTESDDITTVEYDDETGILLIKYPSLIYSHVSLNLKAPESRIMSEHLAAFMAIQYEPLGNEDDIESILFNNSSDIFEILASALNYTFNPDNENDKFASNDIVSIKCIRHDNEEIPEDGFAVKFYASGLTYRFYPQKISSMQLYGLKNNGFDVLRNIKACFDSDFNLLSDKKDELYNNIKLLYPKESYHLLTDQLLTDDEIINDIENHFFYEINKDNPDEPSIVIYSKSIIFDDLTIPVNAPELNIASTELNGFNEENWEHPSTDS